MLDYLKKDRWSPYIVGVLLALLSVYCFYFLHHTLGTSTAFVRLAALFWYWFDVEHLEGNSYYMSYLAKEGWINWQSALVFGVFLGSGLAKRLSKPDKQDFVPKIWKDRFGDSYIKRAVGTFLGGVIILFGARFAGGCTSGHIISGGMQLAISGWLFMIGLFGLGVPSAYLIYKAKKAR